MAGGTPPLTRPRSTGKIEQLIASGNQAALQVVVIVFVVLIAMLWSMLPWSMLLLVNTALVNAAA